MLEFRQTRYTDKRQVPAYTFDDLVGACGGYIGLFLGYALIQFPYLLDFMFNILKKKVLLAGANNRSRIAEVEDVVQLEWYFNQQLLSIPSIRIWFRKNAIINRQLMHFPIPLELIFS